MKTQVKFIVGLWVLIAQFCTTFVRGDLFNFPKKSLLTGQQQEDVRKIFMDTMLEASKAFIVCLQDSTFKKRIKASLRDPEIMKTILLERFFKHSRRKDDKGIVKKFVREISQGEDFEAIVGDHNDALFNGIIRETIRIFEKKCSGNIKDKKAMVKEVFKVLWEGITNKELECNVDINFLNAVRESIGSRVSFDVIGSAYDLFHNTPGDLCDKIATVVSNVLCLEFDSAVENNCCCGCLQTTWSITKKAFKEVLPVIPTLIQVALLIAKEVI